MRRLRGTDKDEEKGKKKCPQKGLFRIRVFRGKTIDEESRGLDCVSHLHAIKNGWSM